MSAGTLETTKYSGPPGGRSSNCWESGKDTPFFKVGVRSDTIGNVADTVGNLPDTIGNVAETIVFATDPRCFFSLTARTLHVVIGGDRRPRAMPDRYLNLLKAK